MRTFPAGRALLAILAVAFGLAFASLWLPTDPYQRWQLLAGTIHERSRWIYERIHYDPTPIDVVVIGSSRTGAGILAPRLAEKTGLNVVNFSLPEAGRNINYAIIDEMLKTKKPRLIVLGVTEKPSRTGHSTWRYLAPTDKVLDPGYAGNLLYLPDLGYQPWLQMKLAAARLAPETFGMRRQFDPAEYAGPVLYPSSRVNLPGGGVKRTDNPASQAELERGVRKFEAGITPPLLPERFADVEFGDERINIRRIAALAQARGIKLAFLAIPYYTGPETVQEEALYRQYGPVWNAGFLNSQPALYNDYAHLDRAGAEILTDWTAERINALLGQPG